MKPSKLNLLIDLDNTLIESIDDSVSEITYREDIFWLNEHQKFVKIRPYTREFLESVSAHYKTTVVTLGERDFAEAVVQILDPEQKFFGGRIASLNEFDRPENVMLKIRCPDKLRRTAILIDRANVWECRENVLRVQPYQYFKTLDDNDDELKHLEKVLIDSEKQFHERYEKDQMLPDIREFLKKHKKMNADSWLNWCLSVFSGAF